MTLALFSILEKTVSPFVKAYADQGQGRGEARDPNPESTVHKKNGKRRRRESIK
jgi:hypothetical protein